MSAFDRLPDQPTAADLARAIQQLHACVEEHRADSRARTERLEQALHDAVQMLMQGQTVLMTALGVQSRQAGENRPVRTIATLTPWQLAWRVAVGTLPLLGLWQWGGKLWPLVWPAVRALNHAITGT